MGRVEENGRGAGAYPGGCNGGGGGLDVCYHLRYNTN